MTLPVYTNPISLAQIQTEFGGTNPASLSEYYAGGAYVRPGTVGYPTGGASVPIPTSGVIKFSNFFGATAYIPGTYLIVPSISTVNEGAAVIFTVTTTNVADNVVLYWETVDATPVVATPTYSIVPSDISLDEGQLVTFTVNTTNIPDGTQLRWTIVDATPGVDSITITTASPLPGGTVAVEYLTQLGAVSSTVAGPYSFSVTSGTLPPGTSLATSGSLGGMMTTAGSYNFTVTVTGGSTTASKAFAIVVAASGSGGGTGGGGGGSGSIEEPRWSQLY